VPAKKTRQPGKTGKAVYLLSADRKYRRLSLKKISARVKGARRKTRGRSIARTATAAEPVSIAARNPEPARVASFALVLAGLFALATLVGASWFSASSVDAHVAAAPTDNAVLTADVASAPVVSAKPLAAAPAAAPAAKAPRTANVSPVPAAVTSTTTLRPTETTKARDEEAQPLAAAAAPVDTVTISGCLDFDGKSAWLKDSSGVDAPRTRSWRSGFLKKRSSRIALVDGPTSAEAYDGRLVSVTGVLVDREMRVSSLTPIAGDCE
jgi:hypothetical protein